MDERIIYVYMDIDECPSLMGKLYINENRGKEIYSFEYYPEWINSHSNLSLDPDLLLLEGRQYTSAHKNIFGLISDSCPDRWGRTLMDRREMIRAREESRKPKKLTESDYLLGVYDESRMGALRFKLERDGAFLSSDKKLSTPPWESLRKLETASIAFENDETGTEVKWLKQLIAPGSSLGGARPKATVEDVEKNLWVAKFPSKNDTYDSGAWEMVAHDLASKCGIDVPQARIERFSDNGSTFLVKRFDREGSKRIHFASAMNLLGKKDGENASYLDLASFIKTNGANPNGDLYELWKRIVFNVAISNNDDHLRNHGFILSKNGWLLSPAFDINPNPFGENLSLDISETDSSIKLDLVKSVAHYFEVDSETATNNVELIVHTVENNWESMAKDYGISRSAIEFMRPAFDMNYKK